MSNKNLQITFPVINGIRYAQTTYKKELIRMKYPEPQLETDFNVSFFESIAEDIDRRLASLNAEDRVKEDAKTEVQHITTIDLKNPITTVENI